MIASLLLVLLQAKGSEAPLEPAREDGTSVEANAPSADGGSPAEVLPGFEVTDAEGNLLLVLPRDETLVYRVHAGLGFVEAAVGRVTQTCRVEPYRRSVFLSAGDEDNALETATLRIHAEGDYSIYSLDSTIETHHLPQDWPRILHRMTQKGSSKRRAENLIGVRDGVPTSSYRRDTTNGAPPGTRVWKPERYREVEGRPVDLLSAVFVCRTLIHSGQDEMSFPLLEKDRLWQLTLRRGGTDRIHTGAGRFDAVEVRLDPGPWPGESIDDEDLERFEGLFGLHGAISVWAESRTGIPLRIEGDLPVGPLSIRIEVDLVDFRGTPPTFEPLPEPKKD